jgi:hypothetical protein
LQIEKVVEVPGSQQCRSSGKAESSIKEDGKERVLPHLTHDVGGLERGGREDAAESLREGLEATLTVLKLGLSRTLTRSLSATNGLEIIKPPSRLSSSTRDGDDPGLPSVFLIYLQCEQPMLHDIL